MRSISARITDEQYNYILELAQRKDVSISQLVKDSILAYGQGNTTKVTPSITEEAARIVTSISDFSHPLLTYIENTGITFVNSEGDEIASISNLKELLNFVQKNVITNKLDE